jgi:hypothetical protein
MDATHTLQTKILPGFQDEITKSIGAPVTVDFDWSSFSAEQLQQLALSDARGVKDSVIVSIIKLPSDDVERKLFARKIDSVLITRLNSAAPLNDLTSSIKVLEQNRWAIQGTTLTFQYITEANSVVNQGSLLVQKLRAVLDNALNFTAETDKSRANRLLETARKQVAELYETLVKVVLPELPLTFEFDMHSIEELPIDKQAPVIGNLSKGLSGIFNSLTMVVKELLANDVCREVLEKPDGNLGLNHIAVRHIAGSRTPKEVQLNDKVLSFKVPFEDNYVGDYWASKISLALEDAFQFSVLKVMKSITDELLPELQQTLHTLLASEHVIISIDWDSVMLSEPSKRNTVLTNLSRNKLDFARLAVLKAIEKLIENYNEPARTLICEQLKEVVIKNVPGDGKGVQRLQFVDHKLILTAPFESVDYRLSWTELYPFLDTSLDVSLKLLPKVLEGVFNELTTQLGGSPIIELDAESIVQAIEKQGLKSENEKKGLKLEVYERLSASKGQLFRAPITEAMKKPLMQDVKKMVISCGELSTAINSAVFNKETGVLSISLLLTQPGVSLDLTQYKLIEAVESSTKPKTWKSVAVTLHLDSGSVSSSNYASYSHNYRSHPTYVVRYGRSLATVTTLRVAVFRFR